MRNIAIDVSGLAWQYRTGVQNLYWALVDAYCGNDKFNNIANFLFYDRSGIFNDALFNRLGSRYQSIVPKKYPTLLRRPAQILAKANMISGPKLVGAINHVWNWSIYDPKGSRGSITIPDLLPLDHPEWFGRRFQGLTKQSIYYAINDAEYIFCISKYVKQRLIDFSSIDPARVHVAYPGISSEYFLPAMDLDIKAVLQKHQLQAKKYVISSGFLDPRKNLKRQIEAFGIYNKINNLGFKYALTGLKNNLSEDLIKLIESPHLRGSIMFLGYVSPQDIKILVSQSAAMMYCSIAEGFGLPIIEGMALGVPVITSSSSSMEELAENRCFLANPLEVDSIIQAISRTLEMGAVERSIMIRCNQEYASKFTVTNWLHSHLDTWLSK
ncbi:MAG: glycosyltransferase family 4 protein [Polynucleobacter sp.]|nr:glycosyltransferase family 4 protein [Polynucleobacter sp.]